MKNKTLTRRSMLKAALYTALLTGCGDIPSQLVPTATRAPTSAPSPTKTLPAPTLAPTIEPTPSIVHSSSPIVAISTGLAHSLALREDGKVYGWGGDV